MSRKQPAKSRGKESPAAIKSKNPVTEYALLALFFIFLALFTTFKITGDDDVFWHMATGRYIMENGHVPSTDVFGFVTQGQEWMPFEWGWDVLTYGLYSAGGYEALSVLRTLVFMAIFGIFYIILRRFAVSIPVIILFFIILSFGIMDRLTPRPHIMSLLFFAIQIYIFFDLRYFNRKSSGLFYFLPAVFLVWANTHMGILAGLFLFGIYVASEFITARSKTSGIEPLPSTRLKALTIVFVLSVLMALVNPNFLQTYVYAFEHTKMKLLETINEWRSPFDEMFGSGLVTDIYKFFLFGGLVVLYYSFRKKDWFPALVFTGFAVYSVRAVRFTVDYILIIFVFFVISVDYCLKTFFKGSADNFLRRSPVADVLLLSLLTFLVVNIPNNKLYLEYLQYYRVTGFGINSDFIPTQMFDFMKEHKIPETGERPLNHFGTGGFLVWNFPESRNFIDSRNLNDEIFSEYTLIITKRPGFESKLKQYDFDYSLYLAPDLVRAPAEMEQTVISHMSRRQDEWKLVFWDDKSFLFLKNLPKFKEVIDKFEYKYVTPYNLIYNRQGLDNGIKNDPERVRTELERKNKSEPNGAIVNTFNNLISGKLKQ